jgi:hypothetical protein
VIVRGYSPLGPKTDAAAFIKADALLGTLHKAPVPRGRATCRRRHWHGQGHTTDHNIDEMSQSIGISSTQLQARPCGQLLVDRSGPGAVAGLLSKRCRRLARRGRGLAGVYGIALKDSQGKLRSVDAVLGDLAEKFKGAGGAGEDRARARAFGRAGNRMIPFLNEGREDRKLREESAPTRIVLTTRDNQGRRRVQRQLGPRRNR